MSKQQHVVEVSFGTRVTPQTRDLIGHVGRGDVTLRSNGNPVRVRMNGKASRRMVGVGDEWSVEMRSATDPVRKLLTESSSSVPVRPRVVRKQTIAPVVAARAQRHRVSAGGGVILPLSAPLHASHNISYTTLINSKSKVNK